MNLENRGFFIMKNSIAIQGIKGSFHHIVTKQYFKNDEIISEFLSFDDLVDFFIFTYFRFID